MVDQSQELIGKSEQTLRGSSLQINPECSSTIEIKKINISRSDLVYISYFDHLLFRNKDVKNCQPIVRETVGWIVKENAFAIWIQWDRTKNTQEKVDVTSGLVILKSCIIKRELILNFQLFGKALSKSKAQHGFKKSEKTKNNG